MTSKERILATMQGEIPDRVPVQLGITNMFSILAQNHVGWDVFVNDTVPYWKVVTDTARHFGLDGYLYLSLDSDTSGPAPRSRTETVHRDSEKVVRRHTIETPAGELWEERTFLKNETPTVTRGLLKDDRDFETWITYCLGREANGDSAGHRSAVRRSAGDLAHHRGQQWHRRRTRRSCSEFVDATETIRAASAYLGQDGTAAGCLGLPGLAHLVDLFDGRLETATYVVYDRPDLVELYREKLEKRLVATLERLLDTPELDYIQIGQSGMLTLSTPQLFRSLCLPTLKKLSKICKEAGVLTELHCCGKARLVVEDCYEQTDLDSINPLQPPPMGDCDLAEVKQAVGHRLCLKGNVGVTEPLCTGSPEDVEADVIRCMDSAKAGGRYILFSEEGIGANTPHENVARYVATGRYYGTYTAV